MLYSNTINLQRILSKLRKIKEYENYYSALCIFHDDTKPSMLVFKDGWFRCLACGRTGDYEMLWRKLQRYTSPSMEIKTEAADWKRPKISEGISSYELIMNAHRILLQNSESLAWYLRMRRIDDRIESQRLGWLNGWYTIPFFDVNGNYKGVGLRASRHVQEATGYRYHIPNKESLYVPDWKLIMDNDFIVVVFGLLDALSLVSLRIPAMSVVHGKAITAEDFNPYRKRLLFFPDEGEENISYNLIGNLGWRGKVIKVTYPYGTKDVNDLLVQSKETMIRNLIRENL